MELFIFLLFIWIVFIQIKLNELTEKINNKHINIIGKVKENIEETPEFENVSVEHYNTENEVIEDLSYKLDDIEKTKKKSFNFDFETTFLGNIFNKIGAIALIIGIIIFIKLISPYIVFTPVMKISIGYLISIFMTVVGYKIQNEKVKGFKETVLGTGVSVAFISTYCASALFHIFSPFIATIIATLILCGVYFIADKQKTLSMIIIALIAGYLNPLLANANASAEFLFGYYIFINLLSIIYVYKNPNRDIINFINLLVTFLILSIVLGTQANKVNIIYPLVLWLIYLIYDVLRKEKSNSDKDKNNILNWMNFGVLTLFSVYIFGEEKAYTGYLVLSVGLMYAGLVIKYLKKESTNYKPYLYSALVTVLIGTFMLTDGVWRICLWSLESLILVLVGYKYKLYYLGNWALGFLLAAVTGVLYTDNVIYFSDIKQYKPILNIRTLSFIFPTISAFISYKILSKYDNDNSGKLSKIFQFSYISLIYLYILFELNCFVYKINSEMFYKNFTSGMLLSIVGFKYALQTKRLGSLSELQLFNIAAYTAGLISLICILTVGFEYEPLKYFYPIINFRFAAYLTAITTAIFFAKWTKLGLFKYLAVILGFILVHIETNDFINSASICNINYLLTVMWLVYAGFIILAGIFKNKKFLKNTGIWISILAICRIFIFDLDGTDMIYKLVAFLTLGAVLMIVSYFYNKYNKE